jgi:phosphoglycolate phosphatase-like HAD superfamily hydrolase
MKAVIFDLDGTLADITHRLHHIKAKPPNWDTFFAECVHDPVYEPIRDLVQLASENYRIILVSGRSAKVRAETEAWLADNDVPYQDLHMRADGDYRQDFVVKSQILDAILAEGNEIAFVVDDRPSVVAMWRERGLTCLQCREWDEREPNPTGLLTLMVGPSGAGKTTWLATEEAAKRGIHSSHGRPARLAHCKTALVRRCVRVAGAGEDAATDRGGLRAAVQRWAAAEGQRR